MAVQRPVTLAERKKRKRQSSEGEDILADDVMQEPEEGSDSDVASLCSAVESGVESDREGAEEPPVPEDVDADHAAAGPAEVGEQPQALHGAVGEEDEALAAIRDRAMRGQHSVWTTGYFTLQNDPAVPYVRVRMLPRWMSSAQHSPGDSCQQNRVIKIITGRYNLAS